MSGDIPLASEFASESMYANFEGFLEGHHAMVRRYGVNNYSLVYMLVRLVRDDLEKARRVFNWAVKRVCMNMLADPSKRFGPSAQELSSQGLHWANRAEETLGTNPLKSLGTIEGIFLLERLSTWAEQNLQQRFHGQSLAQFRKRPASNDEANGSLKWLDLFYQTAYAQAFSDTELFVKRRDCAIALSITSLAGGTPPTDTEIDDVMNQEFPTHQSLANTRGEVATRAGHVLGSLVDQRFVVEWVLGPHQKELYF